MSLPARITAVVNAGTVLSGDLAGPVATDADTVVWEGTTITEIGRRAQLADRLSGADRVIDANGATVAPGLVDIMANGQAVYKPYPVRSGRSGGGG